MTNVVGNYEFPKKPPPYWLAAKRQTGLPDPAIFAIWWKYSLTKQLTAWIAAPPADWASNGMKKP